MSPIISFLVNVSASPGSCSHGNCSLEEWRLLEAVPAAILVPAPAWCCVLCACSAHSSFTNMCIYKCIPIFTFPFSSGKSSENLKVLTDFSGACSAQGHQSWVFHGNPTLASGMCSHHLPAGGSDLWHPKHKILECQGREQQPRQELQLCSCWSLVPPILSWFWV